MDKYVDPNLAEQPCNLLFSPQNIELTADNVTATALYRSAGRLREWKPRDQGQKIPGKSYCYMDYDSRNHLKDISLENKKCDASLFKNNQMISRVFEDGHLENTRTLAHNKCIFEIDNDVNKYNENNVNAFWSTMGTMHCEGIADKIANENNVVENANKKVSDRIQNVMRQINEQNLIIKSRLEQIALLTFEIKTYEGKISNINIEIENVMDKLKKEQGAWSDYYNQNFTLSFEQLKEAVSGYEQLKKELMQKIAQLKAENAKLVIDNKRLFNIIEENRNTFNVNEINISTLKASIDKLNAIIPGKTVERNKLFHERNRQQTKLNALIAENARIKALIIQLTDQYNACKVQLSQCNSNLEILKSKITTLTKRYADYFDQSRKCNEEDLPECNRALVKQINIYNNVVKDHTAWKKLPHYSCEKEIKAYKEHMAKYKAAIELCPHQSAMQDSYTSLLEKSYETKSKAKENCKVTPYNSVVYDRVPPSLPFEAVKYPNFYNVHKVAEFYATRGGESDSVLDNPLAYTTGIWLIPTLQTLFDRDDPRNEIENRNPDRNPLDRYPLKFTNDNIIPGYQEYIKQVSPVDGSPYRDDTTWAYISPPFSVKESKKFTLKLGLIDDGFSTHVYKRSGGGGYQFIAGSGRVTGDNDERTIEICTFEPNFEYKVVSIYWIWKNSSTFQIQDTGVKTSDIYIPAML